MPTQGMKPVTAIYSDVFAACLLICCCMTLFCSSSMSMLAVDRCGVVGEDGDTHQGMFDVGYLRQVPGMKIFCPASFDELREDLHTALYACTGPAAIRYPRGGEGAYRSAASQIRIREGYTCTIICYGTMVNAVLDAADTIQAAGYRPDSKAAHHLPVDWDAIDAVVRKTKRVFVFEETSDRECLADEIFAHLIETGIPAVCRKRNPWPRLYSRHGAPAALHCRGRTGRGARSQN
ncbi:MAG: transketolase C-terminal domain-containing protein [Acutalibacteraceae bacterium]